MNKTILITGASSGIGKATAIYFAQRGWNVAATMRTPEREQELVKYPNIKLFRLDVTSEESIALAITDAIKAFGQVDVLLNNAGYGGVGVFEAATKEQIQQQFDTNVFGLMNTIRAILPYFRERRSGTIINITSVGGIITFPTYSIYHASKWAVEGFAEALQFELRPFNIRVKNIEPGAINTDFYDRSQVLFAKEGLTDYNAYETITVANTQEAGANAPGPEVVAKAVWKAATDSSYRLRYPAGVQASILLFVRRIFPFRLFRSMVRMVVEKGFKSN